MKFECNNTEYEIKEVDNIELSETLIGQTKYQEKTILLKKLGKDLMIRTLKHELMHVWLSEYGHPQNNEETFTYENVCEIVACSNDFINEVVQNYLGIKPLYLCDKEKNTECDKRNCNVCMMTNNIKYVKKKEVCHVENKEWDSLSDEDKSSILKKFKEEPIQITSTGE